MVEEFNNNHYLHATRKYIFVQYPQAGKKAGTARKSLKSSARELFMLRICLSHQLVKVDGIRNTGVFRWNKITWIFVNGNQL
jgi:anthranilate/para-aminobenzoate synthase component II